MEKNNFENESAPPTYAPAGSYPPNGSYPAQPPHYTQNAITSSTVVVAQTAGMPFGTWGQCPVQTTCSGCNTLITTNTSFENGTATWLSIGGLCIFGCCLGCCLIPLCINDLKDVIHTCPNCGILLGKYSRLR